MTGSTNPNSKLNKQILASTLTPYLLVSCASSSYIIDTTDTATEPSSHLRVSGPPLEETSPKPIQPHTMKYELGVYRLDFEAKTDLNVSSGKLYVGVSFDDTTLTKRHSELTTNSAPVMFECSKYEAKTNPKHTLSRQRWIASASIRCHYNSHRIDVYVTIRPSEETYDMNKRISFIEAVTSAPRDTAAPATLSYVFMDSHRSNVMWKKEQTYAIHEIRLNQSSMPIRRPTPLTREQRERKALASEMTIKYTHSPPHNVLNSPKTP